MLGKKGKSTNVCDNCGTQKAPIRRLKTGKYSNAYLCRRCWSKEMRWRRERNTDLKQKGWLDKSTKFPILKFPATRRRKKKK